MFRGFSKLKNERTGSHSHSESQESSRRVSGGKSELAITAPKRIVRALYPYQAQHNDELSFQKNDFFYVNEEPIGDWYLASNPLTNQRGLVPQSYFEIIQRQDPQAVPVSQARRAHSRSASQASGSSVPDISSPTSRPMGSHRQNASQSSQTSNRRASLAIYGLVLYDFQAERNDELTVAAGESIVIVAQSTEEWFVAKPIGRLGGPGLIPVSYVEIREVGSDQPLTDVHDAIRRANLPQVDEWKRKLAEYKASSIPLGRLGMTAEQAQSNSSPFQSKAHSRSVSAAFSSRSVRSDRSEASTGSHNFYSATSTHAPGQTQQTQAPSQHQYQYQNRQFDSNNAGTANTANTTITGGGSALTGPVLRSTTSKPYVISASVDRFAVNGGRYWYLVKVEMSNGKHRNLCRFYQDFYDFQIKLLEQFPVEAGRTGKPRTLPFMPGPLTLVTHTVSSQRRANLDDYVRDLIRTPPHVSQSPIVSELFGVRPGDVESDEATQQLPQPSEDPDDQQQYSGDIPSMPEDVSSVNADMNRGATATTTTTTTAGSAVAASAAPTAPRNAVANPYAPQSHYHQRSEDYGGATNGAHMGQRRQPSQPELYGNGTAGQYQQPPSPYDTNLVSGSGVGGVEEPLPHQSLKIKVFASSNVIAIRVPIETPFSEIYDKIATRLSTPSPKLYTNANCSGEPVDNAAKFARALNGGTKINLYLGVY